MKKQKIGFTEWLAHKMFEEKTNTAICKWGIGLAIGYFIVITIIGILKRLI